MMFWTRPACGCAGTSADRTRVVQAIPRHTSLGAYLQFLRSPEAVAIIRRYGVVGS